MITRFRVDGFKSLVGVDINLGEFTCIAGSNGSGKSNLFDAILFLSHLADHTLLEAAQLVRDPKKQSFDITPLFYRAGDNMVSRMTFEVEMIIPKTGQDDLGQFAQASTTLVTYKLVLELNTKNFTIGSIPIKISEESLTHVKLGDARKHYYLKKSPDTIESLGIQRRTSPFITTDTSAGCIKIHQDTRAKKKNSSGGRPRQVSLKSLPRTVISTVNASEAPTAVLARREMQSWRVLQLEPSAMRASDSFTSNPNVQEDGAHLPATLARLLGMTKNLFNTRNQDLNRIVEESKARHIKNSILTSLRSLIGGIKDINVDANEKREQFSIVASDYNNTRHEARFLSDGTLRFLALATIANDPQAGGLICMEEPENGIHPKRISAILKLLKSMSKNHMMHTEDENQLKQVIINTHSPLVVSMLEPGDILFAKTINSIILNKNVEKTIFIPASDTWRASASDAEITIDKGEVISYLNAIQDSLDDHAGITLAKHVGLECALPFVELLDEEES